MDPVVDDAADHTPQKNQYKKLTDFIRRINLTDINRDHLLDDVLQSPHTR